jgi:hypothetical protein
MAAWPLWFLWPLQTIEDLIETLSQQPAGCEEEIATKEEAGSCGGFKRC